MRKTTEAFDNIVVVPSPFKVVIESRGLEELHRMLLVAELPLDCRHQGGQFSEVYLSTFLKDPKLAHELCSVKFSNLKEASVLLHKYHFIIARVFLP